MPNRITHAITVIPRPIERVGLLLEGSVASLNCESLDFESKGFCFKRSGSKRSGSKLSGSKRSGFDGSKSLDMVVTSLTLLGVCRLVHFWRSHPD